MRSPIIDSFIGTGCPRSYDHTFLWDSPSPSLGAIDKTVVLLGDRVLAKPIAKAAHGEQIFWIARIQL